jgi:hypothetical protein
MMSKKCLLKIDNERISIQANITAINKKHDQIDLTTIKELSKTINKLDNFELQNKREIIKLCIETIKLYQTNIYINYRFPIREDGRQQIRIQFENNKNSLDN